MAKAMLIRVKRLEAAVRSTPVAPAPDAGCHDIMRRLAAQADLFREFAAIAARGLDRSGAAGLAARLAAREARA
jgi:hypothetical protein